MPVTYNEPWTLDRDKVRFYLADTVEDQGPRPEGANFSDDELDSLYDDKGDVDRTVAAALDTLAVQWTQYANLTLGPLREDYTKVAEGYRAQAKAWKREHSIYPGVSCAPIIKVDAYKDDIASDDMIDDTEVKVYLEYSG